MKRCPECRRDYYDDTLLYCLEDGNALVQGSVPSPDEPATAILSVPPVVGAAGDSDDAVTRPQVHTTDQTAVLPRGVDAGPRGGLGVVDFRGATVKRRFANNRAAKLLAAVFLVVILVGGFFGYRYFSNTGSSQINSIAVMPFENRNSDADTDYLSDGLAESVIFRLTQIPDLRVSPTSSVMRYKGKETDIAKIASELGVDAVMTGRLTKRGDNLNITVELVDARTNKSLWGEQYERKLSDLLTTQREIVTEIVGKLQLKLSGESEQKLAKKYTDNNEAYQLYLKGNYFTAKLTKEGFSKGNDYFEQAIRLDPNYALAYNGIAYNQLAAMDWFSEPKVAGPKAKNAVEKAIALGADLAETQQLRGMVAHWVEWDWVTAESAFKQAIKLDQNGYRPFGYYAWFLANMGRNEEAIAAATKGQQLSPVSAEANWYLGMALLAAGKTEDAIARLQLAIDIDPSYFYSHSFLGRAYLQAGKKQEALSAFKKAHELESDNSENWANLAYAYGVTGNRTEAEKIIKYLLDKSKTAYVAPYYFALAYAGLDDKEQTFIWLERAYADRSDSLVLYLTADPQMNSIRIDPRYKDLLKRMGLPE